MFKKILFTSATLGNVLLHQNFTFDLLPGKFGCLIYVKAADAFYL